MSLRILLPNPYTHTLNNTHPLAPSPPQILQPHNRKRRPSSEHRGNYPIYEIAEKC